MKPSALFEALHALIGQRVPLHIWGACGVGKSQIVVNTEALEGAMSDTASDTHRDQDTAQISEEHLAQLKQLADSQGWSLDGTLRRALAVTKAGFVARTAKCTSIAVASGTLSPCADACHRIQFSRRPTRTRLRGSLPKHGLTAKRSRPEFRGSESRYRLN